MKDTILWDDELVHDGSDRGGSSRHRGTLCLQAPDGSLHLFAGDSLPGVCRVLNSTYKKNGKWSFSTWTLKLAPGVWAWTGKGGIVRDLSEQSDVRVRFHAVTTWADVPAEVRPVFRAILKQTSERLDQNEQPV